jgi:hypothetical protein
MISLMDALKSLRPDAQFAWVGHNYAGLIWHDADSPPSEAELEAERVRLQIEYNANEYQRQRASAYPAIDELVVALWEKIVEGRETNISELEQIRQAVKERYPK